MRVLVIVLLTLTSCSAQSSQGKVEALLKQREHAEQTGDFNTWLGLWTTEKARELQRLRPYATAQPSVRYRATKIFVRGDKAVVLAQGGPSNGFATMMLRKESGQWKLQDEVWRETAADPKSVYALLPPDPGAFARAGSPWGQVPQTMDPASTARLGWQIKAVFDESYLYIRIESNAGLPAPGSTTKIPPGGWPILHIKTSSAGEFVLYDTVNIGDQATFDKHGRANSHRPFAAYMIRLERNDHEVFSASADLHPSPLISVAGRDYDIRIPLATMGITDSRATAMTIGDLQRAVVNIAVERYPRQPAGATKN